MIGFLFWEMIYYIEQIDIFKWDIVFVLEGGWINGMKDGFIQVLVQNDFLLFEKLFKFLVGKVVLDGLMELFINWVIIVRIIGLVIDFYL